MRSKWEEAGLGGGRGYNADTVKVWSKYRVSELSWTSLDQNARAFLPALGSIPSAGCPGKTRHPSAAEVDPEGADGWGLPADRALQLGGRSFLQWVLGVRLRVCHLRRVLMSVSQRTPSRLMFTDDCPPSPWDGELFEAQECPFGLTLSITQRMVGME